MARASARLRTTCLWTWRLGRHVDDDVAEELRLAAEAAAGGEAADAVVALLDGVPGRERLGGDGDAVLGEVAEGGGDLALGADAAAAADRIEVDAELAGGGQHRGADGEAAALARRGEDDEGVAGGGHGRVNVAHARPLVRY